MATETRPGTGDTHKHESRFAVLIADDDRGTRETLGEVLENQGFRTILAADGGQAVELVQVELIHVILFDMNMPRLTGLEAFAVIRQTLDKILPAVLMTADATNDLIRRAFQAQVFSVIPKPVNTNIVLNTLSRALAKVYGNIGGMERGTPPSLPPTTTPPASTRNDL
jgi:two-component system, response regulator PdtaR